MRTRPRTNFLLGLAGLAIGVIAMAQALGALPASIYDLLVRAWPALLVMIGLAYLLRGRVRFGGLIAFVVSVALAAGIGAYAFSSRAVQQRDDYTAAVSQPVRDDLALLHVRVNTLGTDVELLRSLDAGAGVVGKFVGSSESTITTNYSEATDGSATLTITETRQNPLPMLASVGRGTLRLELPPTVPIDVEFHGADGSVTLNMNGTRLEHLNVDLTHGNAVVTLPDYQPLYSKQEESLGTLAVRDGDIAVSVPSSIAARLTLDRGGSGIDPEYDPTAYNFLFNSVLEARGIETAQTIVNYNVVATRGRIRLLINPAASSPQPTAAETASP